MKRFLAAQLLLLAASLCRAEDYLFVGVHANPASNKKGICQDQAIESKPLASRQEYAVAAREHYAAHLGQGAWAKLLSPDEAVIFYSYHHEIDGWNCAPLVYKAIAGTDLADVRSQMSSELAKHPRDYKTAPQPVIEWPGSEYRQEFVRHYEGLEVKYRLIRSGSRSLVDMTIHNTLRDKAALLRIGVGNAAGDEFTLPPGFTLRHSLPGESEDISLTYQFTELAPDGKSLPEKLRDAAVKKIRENVTVKEGEGLKMESSGIGVRG